MRSLWITAPFVALAVWACSHEPPPPQTPAAQTHTTSGVYATGNSSYGTSDVSGWGDPAATGTSTRGTATSGATMGAPASGTDVPDVPARTTWGAGAKDGGI